MSNRAIIALFVAVLASSVIWRASGDPDAATTQPATEQQQLQICWDDLEKPDPQASRALLNFSSKPDETIAFLKDKLVPLTISADDVNKLLGDLSSDDETVWKPAFEKLEYLDPRLAIDLSTLMSTINEPSARTRMVEILSERSPDSLQGKAIKLSSVGSGEFNFTSGNGSWWAEAKIERISGGGWNDKPKWTRAIRAIVLLEHFGTPDAIAILKDMATGHPDAAPTKAAQEALTTLGVPAN